MTDNEKRAHDLAVLMVEFKVGIGDVKLSVHDSYKDTFKEYKRAYSTYLLELQKLDKQT